MRLMFSSSDATMAERIRGMLADAGILCEVRRVCVAYETTSSAFYSELWVEADNWLRRTSLATVRAASVYRA